MDDDRCILMGGWRQVLSVVCSGFRMEQGFFKQLFVCGTHVLLSHTDGCVSKLTWAPFGRRKRPQHNYVVHGRMHGQVHARPCGGSSFRRPRSAAAAADRHGPRHGRGQGASSAETAQALAASRGARSASGPPLARRPLPRLMATGRTSRRQRRWHCRMVRTAGHHLQAIGGAVETSTNITSCAGTPVCC